MLKTKQKENKGFDFKFNRKISKKTKIISSLIGIVSVLTLTLGLGLGLGLNQNNKINFGESARNYFANESEWNLSYKDDAKNAKLVSVVNEEKTKNKASMMYELLVYSFADGNDDGVGDFKGAAEKIDYLDKLNVDSLWLSPIHEAPSYHGYDVIDYTSVSNDLGGMDQFDDFLKVAHSKGIKVYIDLVLNHTSAMHPWFLKAMRSDDNNKWKDFYQFNKGKGKSEDLGFSPGETFLANNWVGMPDVNGGNEEVIEEFEAVIEFWTKKGVDGFRFDLFRDLYNSGEPRPNGITTDPVGYLYSRLKKKGDETRREITKDTNEEVFFLGEGKLNENPNISKQYLEYLDPTTNTNVPAFNSIYDGGFLRGRSNLDFNNSFKKTQELLEGYSKDGYNVTWTPFLDNHDENRWIHNYRKDKEKHSTDPMDKNDYDVLRYGLLGISLFPGKPILFQGTEAGYHGTKPDPDLREPLKWNDRSDIEFKQLVAYKVNTSLEEKTFEPNTEISETDYIRVYASKDIDTIDSLLDNDSSIVNDFIRFNKVRATNKWLNTLKGNVTKLETVFNETENNKNYFGYARVNEEDGETILWIGKKPDSDNDSVSYDFSTIIQTKNIEVILKNNIVIQSNIYNIKNGGYAIIKLANR